MYRDCVLLDVGRHPLARVGQGKLADKAAIPFLWNSCLVIYGDEGKANDTIDGACTS